MKRILRSCVLAWALLPAAVAVGQGQNLPGALLPQAKTLPAPDWLKEGVRLTYYSAAATIAGSNWYYWRDDKGDYEGRNKEDMGLKYKRGEMPSVGGHGYTQIDVIALGDKVVTGTISLSFFNGGLVQNAAACEAGPPAGGEWWVNPQALRGIQPVNTKELVILPMPYTIGDKVYNTIRVESRSTNGDAGYNVDLATGLLVHSHISAVAHERKFTWSGDSTSLSQNTLLSVRQCQFPWAHVAPPTWIATVKHFQYEGTTTKTIAAPDTPPVSVPVTFTFEVKDRGKDWLLYTANDAATFASGPAQIGSLWLPPAAMPGLAVGTTLDKDPFTGSEARVTFNGTQPSGAKVVVIEETRPGFSDEFTYDATSGVLQAMRMENRIFVGVSEVTQVHLTQVN